MDDLKVIVGRNLAALRKRRKLTQLELAEQMNYSDKAVSKWEQGATLPDLETLLYILKATVNLSIYITYVSVLQQTKCSNKPIKGPSPL